MNAVLFCALALLGVVFQETQTLLYLNVRKVACSEISQATFKHIMSLVRAAGWVSVDRLVGWLIGCDIELTVLSFPISNTTEHEVAAQRQGRQDHPRH